MEYRNLELEQRGAVLRVWLNRPERRNALDDRTLEEIAHLFESLERNFETRVAVLAGRGVSFCAGADLRNPPGRALLRQDSGAGERERRYAAQIGRRASRALELCEVVTIARVHGHAIGGGLVLAACCDFRLAAEDAIFSLPEVDLGIPLTWGATPRLAHEIGAARARELILMCDRLDGREAESWGLVHRAVPLQSLDATVDAWAERLAQKPEVAVHMTKTQLRAYARAAFLGDVTESDGDLLSESSRTGVARAAFESSSGGE